MHEKFENTGTGYQIKWRQMPESLPIHVQYGALVLRVNKRRPKCCVINHQAQETQKSNSTNEASHYPEPYRSAQPVGRTHRTESYVVGWWTIRG
jgi:hypothetical protein